MPLEFDPVRHVYTLDGQRVPGVTQVMAPLNDFGAISEGVMQAAAARGRQVHWATEELDRGPVWKPAVETIWTPEVKTYLEAWQKFLDDTSFELYGIEVRVFSKRYRYAGALDRVGLLNGRRCVLDIKTTAEISPKVGVQLAAYQQALNEDKDKITHYSKRFACQLRADGTYRLEEFKDSADWSVFLALLTLHNWRTKYGVKESSTPWLPKTPQ